MSGDVDKVQWLYDVECIKQLKHQYCAACDDNYNPDGIARLFTEDGVWDGGNMGIAEGRDGIKKFFANVPEIVDFAIHSVTNPIIEINGDEATGSWKLWQPMVYKDGATIWYAAEYEERYVRTDEGWRFRSLKLEAKMHSPYEDGFGKTRFNNL